MAASGGRRRGAGETREAIGAALSTRGAARRAQVYARQSFQRLICAFAQLCSSLVFASQTRARPRHAPPWPNTFGAGDGRYGARVIKSPNKKTKPTACHFRVRFERFQMLAAPFPSHCNCPAGCRSLGEPRQDLILSLGARKAGVSKDDLEPADSTNVRGVSWSVLRGRCAAPQDEAVGSYESFPLTPKSVARRPRKVRVELIDLSEKQYQVPAGLARNCRFFLVSIPHSRAHSLRSERGVISSPESRRSDAAVARVISEGEVGARRSRGVTVWALDSRMR
jgi:hypothetical protein